MNFTEAVMIGADKSVDYVVSISPSWQITLLCMFGIMAMLVVALDSIKKVTLVMAYIIAIFILIPYEKIKEHKSKNDVEQRKITTME